MSSWVQSFAKTLLFLFALHAHRCNVAAEIVKINDEFDDLNVKLDLPVFQWLQTLWDKLVNFKILGFTVRENERSWDSWVDEAQRSGMMNTDKRFNKHPVMFQMDFAHTPGDVRPYLLVASELYEKSVPILVWAHTKEETQDMANKASLNALKGSIGDATFSGESINKAEVHIWAESGPKFLMLIMDVPGQDTTTLLRGMSKVFSRAKRSVYVTNALVTHDHKNCAHEHCITIANDEFNMGHRQHHIEVSILQGVAFKAPGEVVFNARSAFLFPPCSEYTYNAAPNPLGVISNIKATGSLPGDANDAMNWLRRHQNTLCVAFSSFTHRIKGYASLFGELSRQSNETHILLQVNDLSDTDSFGDDFLNKAKSGWHYIHKGPLPYLKLFPECDSVLHVGGAATTSEVLWAGKPQAILFEETGPDKPSIAQHVGNVIAYVRTCSGMLIGKTQASCQDMFKWAGRLNASDDAQQRSIGSELLMRISKLGPSSYHEDKQFPPLLAFGVLTALRMQKLNPGQLQKHKEALDNEFAIGRPSKALLTVAKEVQALWDKADNYSYTGIPLMFVYSDEYMAKNSSTIQSMVKHYVDRTNNTAFLIGGHFPNLGNSENLHWFKTATDLNDFLKERQFMPLTNFSKAAAVVASTPDPSIPLPSLTKYFIWPRNVWNAEGSQTTMAEMLGCSLQAFIPSFFAKPSAMPSPQAVEKNIDKKLKWYDTAIKMSGKELKEAYVNDKKAQKDFIEKWLADAKDMEAAYMSYHLAREIREFHRTGN